MEPGGSKDRTRPVSYGNGRRITSGSRYPLGTATTAALSAVEQALWDISGKACELPVYKMLGGFFRDKIKVYGSGYLAQPSHFDLDKAPLVESCKATVDAGFSAIKITPQPDDWQKKTAKQIFRDSVERVRRVREAGGRTVHKQGTASGIGVKRSGPYPPA